jgi:hypothetical protein
MIHQLSKYSVTRYSLLLAAMLISAVGCKKADDFYAQLNAVPEIRDLSNLVYGVGDTITFQGRLNPGNDLRIKIGDAEAVVVKTNRIDAGPQSSSDKMDEVKAIITPQMGIGSNRAISITSSGNTIQVPAIEIIASSDQGLIQYPTKLVVHAVKPTNAAFLYCVSGNGSIYIWEPASKTIKKIRKDGTAESIFIDNGLTDASGSFSITAFNSGGVNPQETKLYLSVITSEVSADNAQNTILRLISFDFASKNYTVINRTLIPKVNSSRTLQTVTPFEGAVRDVKLPGIITKIYPDSKGNCYLISEHAISRITVDGQLHFLYKRNGSLPIYNQAEARSYNNEEVFAILPGIPALGNPDMISPDDNVMYTLNPRRTSMYVKQTELLNGYELYDLAPVFVNSGKPLISGSFSIINEVGSAFSLPTRAGMLPLPGNRILSLFYQGRSGTDFSAFPAWGVLDFAKKRGDRYAPGKVDMGGYEIRTNDLILNYDEDGMLYTTANSQSSILKTVKR